MPRASLLTLSLFSLVAAGVSRGERLPVRLYNTSDGLARDSLHCVLSDSDGFLWFCTGEGISRYDGYAFCTWRTTDGLPDRDVRAMIPDREGGFWVGTGDGLASFNPNAEGGRKRFRVYPISADPKAASIRSLLQDASGTVWAGADGGLYRLRGSNRSTLSVSTVAEPFDLTGRPGSQHKPKVFALLEDRSGRIWFGRFQRAVSYACEMVTPPVFPRRRTAWNLLLPRCSKMPVGSLWIGTTTGLAVGHFDAAATRFVVEKTWSGHDGLPDFSIHSLFLSAGGSLWAGTQSGAAELPTASKTRQFLPYGPANGLPDGDVEGFADDSTGGLWMVTDGGGAGRIASDGFISYDGADGLASPRTASMGLDRSHGVFVVTSAPGKVAINRFDGNRFLPEEPAVSRGFFPPTWPAWRQLALQE